MLFRGVAGKGEYHKFLRPWKPAVVVAKRGELNYRVRTDDGKMLCVHPQQAQAEYHPVSGGMPSPDPVSEGADVNVLPPVTTPDQYSQPRDEGCRLRFRPVPLPRRASSPAPPVPRSADSSESAVGADDPGGVPAASAESAAPDSDRLARDVEQTDGSPQLGPSVPTRRSERERQPPDRYGFN